jgi:WD40 repeat protein
MDVVTAAAFDPPAAVLRVPFDPPPPGQMFLAGAADGAVRVWDLTVTPPHPFRLAGPRTGVTAAALSPDRSRAVVGCEDGTVHLWDLGRATGRAGAEPRVVYGPSDVGAGAAVSPDGRWVAVVDRRWEVWVWDLHQTNPVARKLGGAPRKGVTGRPHLLLGDRFLTLLLPGQPPTRWELARPDPEPDEPPGFVMPTEEPRVRTAVTPDRRWVVSLADAGGPDPRLLVRAIDSPTASAYPITTLPDVPKGEPGGAASAVGGLYRGLIAAGGPVVRIDGSKAFILCVVVRGEVLVWGLDPDSGRLDGPVVLPLETALFPGVHSPRSLDPRDPRRLAGLDSYSAVAVSPDGRRVAAVSLPGTVRVWGLPTDGRAPLPPFVTSQRGRVTELAFSPDGTRLASGALDGTVRLWDSRRRVDSVTLSGHTSRITGLVFSREPAPPGRPSGVGAACLVTVSDDGTARVWTLDRDRLIERAKALAREAGPE